MTVAVGMGLSLPYFRPPPLRVKRLDASVVTRTEEKTRDLMIGYSSENKKRLYAGI